MEIGIGRFRCGFERESNYIEANLKLKFRMRYIALSKFVFSCALIYNALIEVKY